jgi:transcriptional regulator
MYIPSHFREADQSTLLTFIAAYDFATLVTSATEGFIVSHLPLLLRRSAEGPILVGHVARANPHWRAMDGQTASLAIFHGPHGYVSPSWYASSPAVPTWNYAVVHATGTPCIRDEEAFAAGVVRDLTHRYEDSRAHPWRVEDLSPECHRTLLGAVVAFEMPIAHLDGKFKLSQNRTPADRAGAISGLEHADSAPARALAALMRTRSSGVEPGR